MRASRETQTVRVESSDCELRHGRSPWWQRWAMILGLSVLMAGCIEEPDGPPAYGVYLGVSVVGQVETNFPEGPAQLGLVRNLFAGPALSRTIEENGDFIDGTQPPFCAGFRFDMTPTADGLPQRPPGIVNADAGALTLSGFGEGAFVDLQDAQRAQRMGTMPTPLPFSSQMQCMRQAVGETTPYGCVLGESEGMPTVMPQIAVLAGGQFLGDSTAVTVDVAGGENVGAYREEGIATPPALLPAEPFDPYAVDPSGVTVAWQPIETPMVMIEIDAFRQDGPGAFILCLERADAGMKEIPEGALALIPEARDEAPLQILTSILALEVRQGEAGWGGYLAAAGRGTAGITCLTGSGPCPGAEMPPPDGGAGSPDAGADPPDSGTDSGTPSMDGGVDTSDAGAPSADGGGA